MSQNTEIVDVADCCRHPLCCVYCDCILTQKDDACGDRPTDRNRDHLIPRSRGGSDHVENCVIACRACNLAKRDKTPSEWRPTGLPPWVYEKEKALAAKYRMPARGRQRAAEAPKPTSLRIPGYGLLRTRIAVCLECLCRDCRSEAEWEVHSPIDGTWGAYCYRCAHHWAEHLRRELNEQRGVLHVLVQLREGTLDLKRETTLCALARTGGVSLEEYIDLAIQMVVGETAVRVALKDTFPNLHLELWESEVAPC